MLGYCHTIHHRRHSRDVKYMTIVSHTLKSNSNRMKKKPSKYGKHTVGA